MRLAETTTVFLAYLMRVLWCAPGQCWAGEK